MAESKIVMAKSYAHGGLTNMQRKDEDDYEEAQVSRFVNHPQLGLCDVHFPKDAVRLVNDVDRGIFAKRVYRTTFGAPDFKLLEDDFATQDFLDGLEAQYYNDARMSSIFRRYRMNEARLVINGDDFTTKLQDFTLACNKCGSHRITLDIDWAAYPSGAWCQITAICEDCGHDEEIYGR